MIIQPHKEFLLKLIKCEVEFLLVGGHAVIFHGYPRTTLDMDLWIKPDNENKLRLIIVFKEIGISEEGLKQVENLNFSDVHVFHMGEKPNQIDFLTKMQGLKFDEVYKNKVMLPLADTFVPVIHLTDLLVNKMLSGRLKDQADLDELKKVNKL
ncbi:MAG: hypothetical protein WCO54_06390 [Bacteroidota bacterium]